MGYGPGTTMSSHSAGTSPVFRLCTSSPLWQNKSHPRRSPTFPHTCPASSISLGCGCIAPLDLSDPAPLSSTLTAALPKPALTSAPNSHLRQNHPPPWLSTFSSVSPAAVSLLPPPPRDRRLRARRHRRYPPPLPPRPLHRLR